MARRLIGAGIVAALVAFAAQGGTAAAAARASTPGACSTHGLTFSSHVRPASAYSVVALRAHGLPCATARTVASRVAQELLHGQGISVSGAVGFGMTEQSCTGGCGAPTTSVSISYPHGTITVSLRGAASGSGGTTPAPTLPTPGEPGTIV
jgi:hypothetical protein